MKKRFLKKFNLEEEYNSLKGEIMQIPHVVLLKDMEKMLYVKEVESIDYSKEYFTIEVLEDCTFNLAVPTAANAIKYKHNDNDWVTTNTNVDITCLANDTVQLSCVCPSRYSGEDTMRNHHFGLRVPFNAYGNVMSLIYGDDFAEQYTLNSNNVFDSLFHMLPIVSAKNLILPATTLSEHCYANMFFYCQMLTEAPQLLATTLSKGCYKNMFGFCTTLTQAPELMADIVAQECYYQMFYGCEALTKAPSILPSMTLDYACYFEMFRECYALTTLPQLPATTLAASCYEYMFDSCSEISSTMELPSTVLATRCYYGMFNYCTNLISTPQLKATTLADECYKNMFKSCSNLTTISELPATTLANNCYESMFEGCKKITTAPQLKAIKMGVSSCQYMFKGCTSLIEVPELIATTLANNCYYSMFENCKALESTIDLPSTTLADGCYNSMFKGCSKLTNVIELKATTLANRCYANMFYNCTSLTSVPKLKATTLADECYYRMFYNTNVIQSYPIEIFTNETIVHSGGLKGLFSKTKITDNDLMNILPINSEGKYHLPVLTLANNCYDYMFENCSYLTTSPELPATNNVGSGGYSTIFNGCNSLISGPSILPATSLSTRCYYNMFNGCVSLVNAPELPSVYLSEGCYENMFYGCHSLLTAPELKSVHLTKTCYKNMFNGCLRLNNITMLGIKYSTDSLYHWVSGVGYEGNFIKAKSALLPSGVNGIPENWSIDEIDVEYDYSKEYLTIEALEDGLTVSLSQNASYYRINGGNWISLSASTTTPSINNGQTIQFRITNPTISSTYGIGRFTINKKCNVSGNIMSLLYGDNFEGQINLSGKNYAFQRLFAYCKTLQSAENLVLPATTLAYQCYIGMFDDCISLTTAPALPATTLASNCYRSMFDGCDSLTTAPELPATTLADECYYFMFCSCDSLTTAPALPATALTYQCYREMFYHCDSLTTAPELPATKLAKNCYFRMFEFCDSLTTAPALPATALAYGCYDSMFAYCTSLTEAPQLPATTLATYCYASMFNGCTSLKEAPALPATKLAETCYQYMFKGCTSLKEAPALPSTTLALGCYFRMLEGTNVLPDCSNIDFANESVLASGGLQGLFAGTKVTDEDLMQILPINNEGKYYLPVTTLARYCYNCMFYDCTSLKTAPKLPSTTLAVGCYANMFRGCTSLTETIELPATTLADNCYQYMFSGCTSLTESPKLAATTLANECYYYMFRDCSNLNKITMLATDISASSCLSFWVSGVASEGTFIKDATMTSLPKGIYGIPNGWTVKDYNNDIDYYSLEFFTLEALEDGEMGFCLGTGDKALESLLYSIDDGDTWSEIQRDDMISVSQGQKVLWKQDYATLNGYNNRVGAFYTTMPFNAYGNIMSLLYGDDFQGQTSVEGYDSIFLALFDSSNIVSANNLILPATTLTPYCYYYMFNGCTSLTTAPQLPSTTLADSCYAGMFGVCTSLTEAPELPATTLADYCYWNMFVGCSKLNHITMLATDISASTCLTNWVSGVASSGTFVKNAAMTSLPLATYDNDYSGIPEGWTVTNTFNNVYPCIINQTSESITFNYSDGLFTPTNEVIDLSQYFTKTELLSIQPECEMTVTLLDKTDTVLVSDYVWSNEKTFSDVLNELGVTKDVYDINVIITKINAPEDNGYYYYYTIEETSIDYSKEYFTIEALEDGLNVKLSQNASQYRIDGGNWMSLSANTTTPSINSGQKIQFKITNPTISTYYGIGTFTINKKCNVSGNIMSLLYEYNFVGQIDLSGKNYAFGRLFQNCTTLQSAENLILPATRLANNCYQSMFYGCYNLTAVPELLATTLTEYCYDSMFRGCTSLTEAPELPATRLAYGCYISMFRGCTSLTEAPELPSTKLASQCYYYMFEGCTSLTEAPQLLATTLASSCYSNMFNGTNVLPDCSNIDFANEAVVASGGLRELFAGTKVTDADLERILPKNDEGKYCLPATKLAKGCYWGMFQKCTNLTEAPQLLATTLADNCYQSMFYGCTSLTETPQLLATTLVTQCYYEMFYGCSKLNYIKMLATNISASSCLSNWVKNVAENGTFIKNAAMTSLPSGVSGIPTGWTVENA